MSTLLTHSASLSAETRRDGPSLAHHRPSLHTFPCTTIAEVGGNTLEEGRAPVPSALQPSIYPHAPSGVCVLYLTVTFLGPLGKPRKNPNSEGDLAEGPGRGWGGWELSVAEAEEEWGWGQAGGGDPSETVSSPPTPASVGTWKAR